MIVHKPSGKLLLNLNDPARVTTVIPTARMSVIKGHHIVSVPHMEDEVRVLRNLGFDPPAPIEHYYDWPGRHQPFIHQRTTASFLTVNPWSFCLNGMGSGKTLSVLWAFDHLKKRALARRMLVVAPLSTLVRTWADEVFSNMPHLTVAVLHGTMDRRLKLLDIPHDIYVVNHDGIKSKELLDALCKREDIDALTIDELAAFRTAGTQRFKAMQRLVHGRKYVWGLTGTPTPNAPTDAWAQCRLISPAKVPKYFGQFRDQVMKQVSQFKWVARDSALEIVKHAMQPAIRFSREDCIDLPPTIYQTHDVDLTPEQKRAFDDMVRTFRAEYAGGQVLAVNEAVKLGKLVQICCLSAGTLTLTRRGWVRLVDVRHDDEVWDGVEWVRHLGLVSRGVRRTVQRGGLWLTPDHRVLSPHGWVEAKEIKHADAGEGFDWAPVRLPAGYPQSGVDSRADSLRNLAVRVRLRSRGCSGESEPPNEEPTERAELRLPAWALERGARHVQQSTLPHLGADEAAVLAEKRQGLAEIWRSGHHCLQQVGRLLRRVLAGHAWGVSTQPDPRSVEQRRPILTRELPVGDTQAAGAKPAEHVVRRDPPRAYDADGRSGDVRYPRGHVAPSADHLPVERGPRADDTREEEVYDLVQCGPRERFTVCGPGRRPMLVHNCGVAYTPGGGEMVLPSSPRIELCRGLIEEADAKVIVFVPLTGALEHLARELAKTFTVEVVHGGTSKTERDRIFGAFQKHKDPHVLVANAGAMSHGLTLTAANTIIWYGPPTSNDTYIQANARIVRPGQKLSTLIVHIESTPIEARMFDRLRKKGSMQGALLDMLKGE